MMATAPWDFVKTHQLTNRLHGKIYRERMRKYALLWRHSCSYREWETATVALRCAMECRELAKHLTGGAR